MRSRNKIFYGIAILIGMTILVLAVIGWYMRKPSYNWDETYNVQSVEPYGTSLLKELMEAGDFTVKLSGSKLDKKPPDAEQTYFFIGNNYFLDEEQWEVLKKHVAGGAQAIIVTKNLPYTLREDVFSPHNAEPYIITPDEKIIKDEIEIQETDSFPIEEPARIEEDHPDHTIEDSDVDRKDYVSSTESYSAQIKSVDDYEVCATIDLAKPGDVHRACYNYTIKDNSWSYSWTFLDDPLFHDTDFVPLGHLNEKSMVNYFSYRHGKGHFIFHTSPIFFTNFNVIKADRKVYLYHFLSRFKTKNVYWDSYAQRSHSGGPMNFSDSPLIFIMNNFYLRNAWYLFLVAVLLFFIFGVKRLQRPIPVLPVRKNSTLEFLKVLAQLFFRDNNNKAISSYLTREFLLFVRKRYNISLEGYDREQLTRLQNISGVELEIIENIFAHITLLYSPDANVQKQELIDLNKYLNQFYKDCL